ncbi:hypothetical protein DID88_009780 [Monilinia fructigena]|uniref:Uncharacterized protein n=1 Tax=Monilinia fructigena TaxID=38457 RepID=A0A395IK29_9HELO|nr:hypothetical protein DID88_009780 [Monilinia fructigena]
MTTSPPTTPQFPQVDLIPWDPDSPSHVSRLFNQRVACTWNSEFVEPWRERQRQGAITLQWIVLPMVPTRDHLHTLHISQFPLESEPLIDSATTFNGVPRTPPSPPTSFLPIGHIALEVQSPSPSPPSLPLPPQPTKSPGSTSRVHSAASASAAPPWTPLRNRLTSRPGRQEADPRSHSERVPRETGEESGIEGLCRCRLRRWIGICGGGMW